MEDAAGMVLISTANAVTLPAPPSSYSSCCCYSVCHPQPPLCAVLRAERCLRQVLSWPSVCLPSLCLCACFSQFGCVCACRYFKECACMHVRNHRSV